MKEQPDSIAGNTPWGLFVTDLDGTLLSDDKRISENNLIALRRLRCSGCHTAIATGRSDYSLFGLFDQLGFPAEGAEQLPIDYYVFSTGAGVMAAQGRSLLKTAGLSNDDVLEITSILEQYRIDYMVHQAVPNTRYFVYSYHGGSNPDFLSRLDLYRQFASPSLPQVVKNFGAATEVLCILPGEIETLAETLMGILARFSVIKATSPLDHRTLWLEIFPSTVSKGLTLSWLADFLRVKRSAVCTVGNDYNDTDMLAWAGTGFVVQNSPESLRAQFPVVAGNNEDGVALAATRWLRQLGRQGDCAL